MESADCLLPHLDGRRTIERMNPTLAGRPDVLGARTSLTLYEEMEGMLENSFMSIKNRSSKITAELDIPTGGANGAILSQGGRFGGAHREDPAQYLLGGRDRRRRHRQSDAGRSGNRHWPGDSIYRKDQQSHP